MRQFYLRDDASRLTTGKKKKHHHCSEGQETKNWLLCDLLQNLHMKFVSEHGDVSYTFFCRQRPFWVVKQMLRIGRHASVKCMKIFNSWQTHFTNMVS